MFCWLRQWRISSALDDGRDIPPALRRHAEHCRPCGRFLECSRRLESLRPSAAAPMVRPRSRKTIRPRWVAAASAAAIAAVMVLWLYRGWSDQTEQPPPSQMPVVAEQDEPDQMEAYLSLSRDWADRSLATLSARSTEPLQRELELISRDVEALAVTLAGYVPRPLSDELDQLPDIP